MQRYRRQGESARDGPMKISDVILGMALAGALIGLSLAEDGAPLTSNSPFSSLQRHAGYIAHLLPRPG